MKNKNIRHQEINCHSDMRTHTVFVSKQKDSHNMSCSNNVKLSLNNLQVIEKFFGYKFNDTQNILHAIYHPGVSKCKAHLLNFQRLEFLGDRILGLVIAHYLYENTCEKESELAIKLSRITSTVGLISSLKHHKLIDFLIFPQDFFVSEGKNSSGLADMVEAMFGAIYLDSNYHVSQKIILDFVRPVINDTAIMVKDYKSRLQEYSQMHYQCIPEYELVSTTGDAHNPLFTVKVIVNKYCEIAIGSNKKKAQHEAALKMCEFLKII